MIAFSCEAGAILAKAPNELRLVLRGYAHDLGLAFQIADDLLDAEGDEGRAGKALAFLGPIIFGTVSRQTGSQRPGWQRGLVVPTRYELSVADLQVCVRDRLGGLRQRCRWHQTDHGRDDEN